MSEAFKNQEDLQKYFATAYGWATFQTIGKAGFGIGGAGGRGDVWKNNGDGRRTNNNNNTNNTTETLVGEARMMQLSFGFQFGGQLYREIIFFESEKDFQNFTAGNFEFGAEANAIALTASASVKATTMGVQGITTGLASETIQVQQKECTYTKGMAVFTVLVAGLMYQATVSGQKFSYTPLAVVTAGTVAVAGSTAAGSTAAGSTAASSTAAASSS